MKPSGRGALSRLRPLHISLAGCDLRVPHGMPPFRRRHGLVVPATRVWRVDPLVLVGLPRQGPKAIHALRGRTPPRGPTPGCHRTKLLRCLRIRKRGEDGVITGAPNVNENQMEMGLAYISPCSNMTALGSVVPFGVDSWRTWPDALSEALPWAATLSAFMTWS